MRHQGQLGRSRVFAGGRRRCPGPRGVSEFRGHALARGQGWLRRMHLGNDEDVKNEPDFAAWAKLDAKTLQANLRNDLEPAAFDIEPKLRDLREEFERNLKRPVRMSGSGSTLFTLYDTREEADSAALPASAGGVKAQVVELVPE